LTYGRTRHGVVETRKTGPPPAVEGKTRRTVSSIVANGGALIPGAANTSAKQLNLAFELGKRRILRAVESCPIPGNVESVVLLAADIRGETK
jgi:hypothetical protein